jgi:CubicO group peptidase (beta-lactamase class C family)
MTTTLRGRCDTRFEGLRGVFEKGFEKGEVGAAVAVTLGGEPVVDLWGGFADAARSRPWARDTIVNVYSTTKGVTALCAHRLVEAGKLDLDAPVARYWPEFAQAGKGQLPVRYLLSHQAGLPAVRKPLSQNALYDWPVLCEALAEETPWWEPGTQHGYHALTYGHLVGEVFRRIEGRSVGRYFHDELARPLGLDFWIGTPASEHPRCAEMIPAPSGAAGAEDVLEQFSKNASEMVRLAFNNPAGRPGHVNSPEWRSAEIPAGNGHGDALSLARLYGGLACGGVLDGVHLLAPEAIRRATTEQAFGKDAIIGFPMRWGLGFMLRHDMMPLGPNDDSFGHAGAGGSIAFADPSAGIGFAYVMNQMQGGTTGDPRGFRLIGALYQALAASAAAPHAQRAAGERSRG